MLRTMISSIDEFVRDLLTHLGVSIVRGSVFGVFLSNPVERRLKSAKP